MNQTRRKLLKSIFASGVVLVIDQNVNASTLDKKDTNNADELYRFLLDQSNGLSWNDFSDYISESMKEAIAIHKADVKIDGQLVILNWLTENSFPTGKVGGVIIGSFFGFLTGLGIACKINDGDGVMPMSALGTLSLGTGGYATGSYLDNLLEVANLLTKTISNTLTLCESVLDRGFVTNFLLELKAVSSYLSKLTVPKHLELPKQFNDSDLLVKTFGIYILNKFKPIWIEKLKTIPDNPVAQVYLKKHLE